MVGQAGYCNSSSVRRKAFIIIYILYYLVHIYSFFRLLDIIMHAFNVGNYEMPIDIITLYCLLF